MNDRAKDFIRQILNFRVELKETTKQIEYYLNPNFSDHDANKFYSQSAVAKEQQIHSRYEFVINKVKFFSSELKNIILHDIARGDVVSILDTVLTSYEDIWQGVKQLASTPARQLDAINFFQERQKLGESNEFSTWESMLTNISSYYKQANYTPRTCFISYAWPIVKNAHEKPGLQDLLTNDESWVQEFLIMLRADLRLAGITAILDIKDNDYGNNIYQFMDKVSSSNFVLLVGTQALLKKHQTGLANVCNELIGIERKRREDRRLGLAPRVFPLLLSGNPEQSFPAQFERYSTIKDWQYQHYLTSLKKLIGAFYLAGPDNADYEKLWQGVADKFSNTFLSPNDYQKPVNKLSQATSSVSKTAQMNYGSAKNVTFFSSLAGSDSADAMSSPSSIALTTNKDSLIHNNYPPEELKIENEDKPIRRKWYACC